MVLATWNVTNGVGAAGAVRLAPLPDTAPQLKQSGQAGYVYCDIER